MKLSRRCQDVSPNRRAGSFQSFVMDHACCWFQTFYHSRRSSFFVLVSTLVRLVVSTFDRTLSSSVLREFVGSPGVERFLSEVPYSLIRASLFSRGTFHSSDEPLIAGAVTTVSSRPRSSSTRELLLAPVGAEKRWQCFNTCRVTSFCERTPYRPQVGWAVFGAGLLGVVGSTGRSGPTETVLRQPSCRREHASKTAKRLIRGDAHIGRGSRRRNVFRSQCPTTSKSRSTGGMLRFASSLKRWRRTPSYGPHCWAGRAVVLSVTAG